MATITKPLTAVVHVLSVAFGYIANKIIPQGIRKAFNNEGPDGRFIPVTYIPLSIVSMIFIGYIIDQYSIFYKK